MKRYYTVLRALLISCALGFAGCAAEESPPSVRPDGPLSFALLPDENPDAVRDRYGPLVSYLNAATGMPIELVIPESYSELLQQVHERRVDMAWFGAVTFLKARARDGLVPLVSRDIDARFTSKFVTRAGDARGALADYRGRSFAFGDTLSTSGHLMPRYFLEQLDIVPEEFFSQVRYSGAHDRSVQLVLEGEVDIAAVNGEVIDSMLKNGRLPPDRVRVLWETPPYQDYVVAVHPDLAPAARRALRNAFLSLSLTDSGHARVLSNLSCGGFLPVGLSDYESLIEVIGRQHLLDIES